jgi:hypothetical protein
MSLADPYQMLQDVCDRELGFQPLNFSVKPVHVANGLARALTQRSYKTDALARTLRRYVIKQTLGVEQERHPNTEILEKYPDAFEPLRGTAPDPQRLSRLRALALDVLGADGAVFDQEDKSSYTLSNERFVTKDPSDRRAGLFLARLIQADHGDADGAESLLLDLLASEGDAWTTLALPLLQFGTVREETADGDAGERAASADHLFAVADGRLRSRTLAVLRESYDRLGRFERMGGSKLNSLRRLVLFGCFGLHIHAISRWNERNPTRPRPPILLDMFDGSVSSVRDASRASLRAAGDAIEFLILDCFKEEIEGVGTAEDELLSVLNEQSADETLVKDFQTYLGGEREPVDALSRALVDAAFARAREHPIGSLIELGRRAGFLSPWANSGRGGKLQKRYTATAEFLEILVAATVEPDDPLEFPEFLDRLKADFGILVGRPEDDPIIRRNNLLPEQFGPPTSINEEDLRRNVTELRHLLIETGYGKSYADGRTIVTTEPEVLV